MHWAIAKLFYKYPQTFLKTQACDAIPLDILRHPYNHTHFRIQHKVLFVGPDPKEMFKQN